MARVPPRRGGEHPIYGIFLEVGELNNQYQLIGTRYCKFTGQRRSAKVINSIEQALLSTIQSSDQSKFDGNLETTSASKGTELDKLNFIK